MIYQNGIYTPPSSGGGGTIAGSGTLNYLAKFTPDGTTIGNSQLFDNGTNIGFGIFSGFTGNTFITIKDPGTLFEDATIRITDFADNLMFVFNNNGKFGIGTDEIPDAYLQVIGTTEQARWGYDNTTNYASLTVTSAGLVQLDTNTTAGFQFLDQVYNLGNNSVVGCTAFGLNSLVGANAGGNNTAYGTNTLQSNTTAAGGVAIGFNTLQANTTGNYNVGLGNNVLAANVDGYNNIGIGGFALDSNVSGFSNIGIGYNSLTQTTGSLHVAIGDATLVAMTSAAGNVAVGYAALTASTGNYNVGIGLNGGAGITSGTNNVAIGVNSGYVSASASNNIHLGAYAGHYETLGNTLIIDSLNRGTLALERSNSLIYGVFDASVANQRLTINGSLIGGSAALATTATDGFWYVPSCAGTPTGTPTAHTGTIPMVADSTNNKLYIYSGGAWVALN